MSELSDDPFQAARLILTLRREGVTAPAVLRAIETVPRSMFIARDLADLAYEDCVLPIGCGQTLERPSVIATMLQALKLQDVKTGARVLIVGAGSGYTAALVAEMAEHVFAVERFRRLADRAVRNLTAAGIDSVQVRHDDGLAGWHEQKPFHRILLTGAVPEIPDALLGQLGKNGFCVAPITEKGQTRLIAVNADGTCLHQTGTVFHAPLQTGVSKAL